MSAATIDWIVPQVEDLNDYLASRAIVAFREKALATGQQDPFDNIMIAVTDRIRAEVRGCRTNQVSETPNAIPPSLKQGACLLILEGMQFRLPGLNLTTEQAKAIDDFRRYLQRISKCEVPIEAPTDPEPLPTVQQGGGPSVVKYRCPQFTFLSEMP